RPFEIAPTASYWGRQLRETVQFANGVQSAHALGCTVFVEIGPGSSLLTLSRLALQAPAGVLSLPSLRRGADDWAVLLDSLARLSERGGAIDWEGFDRDYPRRKANLPHYPFERTRFWLEDTPAHAGSNGKHTPSNGAGHESSTVVELLREQSLALRRLTE